MSSKSAQQSDGSKASRNGQQSGIAADQETDRKAEEPDESEELRFGLYQSVPGRCAQTKKVWACIVAPRSVRWTLRASESLIRQPHRLEPRWGSPCECGGDWGRFSPTSPF